MSTPKHSSSGGSGSDEKMHSPSTAAAARSRSSRSRGNNGQASDGSDRKRAARNTKQTSRKDRQSTRPYYTISCMLSLLICFDTTRVIMRAGPLNSRSSRNGIPFLRIIIKALHTVIQFQFLRISCTNQNYHYIGSRPLITAE